MRWVCALKKTVYAAEQERPDVQDARDAWQKQQPQLDITRLVFIDETSANTRMARLYGRAPIGERLVCKEPWGHWKTVTFTAALRVGSLTAPWLLDGPMDGDSFRCYAQNILAPTLKKGDIVIMDNLPSHKVAGIREAIEATGATLLYLPPYSPDLNPIEQAFSKIKALLRKAAARSLTALTTAFKRILALFTPTECQNFFAHAGYSK